MTQLCDVEAFPRAPPDAPNRARASRARDVRKVTSMDVVKIDPARLRSLPDYHFAPHFFAWQGKSVHYLDEPAIGVPMGTFLLLHGEPSWSYLYRHWIPRLTAAGYRCVAPDFLGFGGSDKPTDDNWYVIERHCEMMRALIDALDLHEIHLVVQDWGGPIGLRQAVDQPQRFAGLFILNTWLHHEGFEYTDAIRWWRGAATDPAMLGGDMPTGRIVAGSLRRPGHDIEAITAAYDAPFDGPASKAGARRFPVCIPFGDPTAGNADQQQRCHDALRSWSQCPVHVIFGTDDMIFPPAWGQAWTATIPGATYDPIVGAGHFVQEDAPDDCVDAILSKLQGA